MASRFETELSGGKAFSLGNTVEVVEAVLADPQLFDDYLELFSSADSQVVMRASNGLKRIFHERPEWFEARIDEIIDLLAENPQDSARWTLVQIVKTHRRLLSDRQMDRSIEIARRFVLESAEWITLAQSMDLLLVQTSRWRADSLLSSRIEELTKDSRKAVAGKAKKLAEAMLLE